MLVVNGHALVAVHTLHFVHQVGLRVADTADFQQFLRIDRTIGQQLTGHDRVAVLHLQFAAHRQHGGDFGATVVDDVDLQSLAVVLADSHNTRCASQEGRTAGVACLEQFHDARQTTGDVLARHTTGVERTHRELGSRLSDRLRRNHADCFAEFDLVTGCQ